MCRVRFACYIHKILLAKDDIEYLIWAWYKACDSCQRNKVVRHTKSPIGILPDSDEFEHVCMNRDTMENIDGYCYIYIFIDLTTRWVETITPKETSAERGIYVL